MCFPPSSSSSPSSSVAEAVAVDCRSSSDKDVVTPPACCVVLSGTGTDRARDDRELDMELILRTGRRNAADVVLEVEVEVDTGKRSEEAVEEDELEELLVGGTMSLSGSRPGRFGGIMALIPDVPSRWNVVKRLRKSGETAKLQLVIGAQFRRAFSL